MSVLRRRFHGTPLWIYGWFVLDALLVLTPPLHWAVTGSAMVLGVPAAVFYFVAAALFVCTSLVAAYLAEVAAGSFGP
ncbi:hypothetical protein W911_10220 [Hyphomicrobium nitrativorans NL23]|uniref:Uncharacterized protein n=1 Tax=Hyphomicrobium nitrativorans NL23 TaxID=1029756 RepID=V5SDW4_9HYPH|nr:hypothetical protein [Hyphomicrobium nitrativorans]AHB48682.1 hypothetical protein W911_10220 [Hyphomicrobium nitrativorans NL23]